MLGISKKEHFNYETHVQDVESAITSAHTHFKGFDAHIVLLQMTKTGKFYTVGIFITEYLHPA